MDTAAVGGSGQALALEAMEAVDAQALAAGEAADAEAQAQAQLAAAAAGAGSARSASKTAKSSSAKKSTAKKSTAKKSTGTTKSTGSGSAAPKPVSTTKVQATGAAAVSPALTGYAAAGAAAATRGTSLEDKLFEFMKGYVEKMEKELDQRITEYKAAVEKQNEKKSGGGIFGKIADAIGGDLGKMLESVVRLSGGLLGTGVGGFDWARVGSLLAEVTKVAGKDAAEALFKSVGGPLLAAIGTAIGGPALGMLVAQLGPKVIEQLVKEVRAGGSSTAEATSSGSAPTESKGPATASEQLQMMEIQRLIEKLQRMYSTISNVMKSLHDMKMSAIGNIR